jgi:Txe/YoeB family toxin of toxin-antitoxin system
MDAITYTAARQNLAKTMGKVCRGHFPVIVTCNYLNSVVIMSLEGYLFWQKTDKKILRRINTLLSETQRDPFEGIGKPEPLKHALSGYRSRRITDERRRMILTVFSPSMT